MNNYFEPRIVSVLTEIPTAEGGVILAHIPQRIPSNYEEFLIKKIQELKNKFPLGDSLELIQLRKKLDEFRKTHPFNPNISMEELRELNL